MEREDEFDRSPAPESPGPGGVRRPAGAAPDDEGTDGEVSLDSGLGCLEAASPPGADELGSPTVSGGRALVRLAPEVWPDAEAGSGGDGRAGGGKEDEGLEPMEVVDDGGGAPRPPPPASAVTGSGNGSERPSGGGW